MKSNEFVDLEATRAALLKLSSHKDPTGPFLIDAFFHSEKQILRSAAIVAAGQYDDPFSKSLVDQAVNSKTFVDRHSAANSLNLRRDPTKIEDLRESSLSYEEQYYIYSSLYKFGKKVEHRDSATKWLSFLGQSEDLEVRRISNEFLRQNVISQTDQ